MHNDELFWKLGAEQLRTKILPKPSALMVAILRAVHQILDSPLIHDDPLALQILGPEYEQFVRSNPQQFNSALLRGLRASLVVRSRLAADQWHSVQQAGINQYVILGAGLDTAAYHRSSQAADTKTETRIFEVDIPEMQSWKRHCLKQANIKEPANVTFVSCNFEQPRLIDTLKLAGFDLTKPAFFSWLGVTMYIEPRAVTDTLTAISSLTAKTSVLFDYIVAPSLLTSQQRASTDRFAQEADKLGEGWKSNFDPSSLKQELSALGFTNIEDIDTDEQNRRFLQGREDGLSKTGAGRLILATI